MALRQATERMTLDVSRLEVQTSLAVTQGDTMRRWEIKLTDRGQPIEIGKRWTAALSGIKPDGKKLYNGCTVQDGRIVYDFASGTEIATAAGAYEITLAVYDEAGDLLHTPKIWLNVLQNRNRSIASDDQFTEVQEIIRRINEAEEDIDEIEQTNEQQGDDIEAAQGAIQYLESKTTTVQTVSVPKSSWTDSTTVNIILDKPAPASNALIIPATGDTRRQVVICQIEVEDERETEDGWIVSLSRGELIPETDLEFVVYVMRGDTEREIGSTALLLAPAGGESNIRIADDLTTDLGYVALSARMGKKLNETKAPAGYGLGGQAQQIDSWRNALESGFYCSTVDTPDGSGDTWYGIVVKNLEAHKTIVQKAWAKAGIPCSAERVVVNGVFGEWEWVNPPVQVGVEYRTTERWQGLPVYVRWLSVGWLPDNSELKVTVNEEINEIFHIDGYAYSQDGAYSTTFTASDTISVGYRKSTKELTVTTSFPYATQGGWGSVAFIKYIK